MNPYLKDYRLQDVIAALQIMGSYHRYKMSVEDWTKKIENKPLSVAESESWRDVFKAHPEFFRENEEHLFSLMWRKGMPHTADSKTREPLSGDQIMALMDTALQFHAKAKEEQREKRWWLPLVAAAMGFAGAVIGAYLKSG